MSRLSEIDQFKQAVRDSLIKYLPKGFTADNEKPFRIVRHVDWGEQYIWIDPISKNWPYAQMVISFGVIFKIVAEVDRIAGRNSSYGPRSFWMNSMNLYHMKGLRYIGRLFQLVPVLGQTSREGMWHFDASDDPNKVAARLRRYITGVVVPFFARFCSLHEVRNSLEADDHWLMGSQRHEEVLLIDIALNDQQHFHHYISTMKQDKNFCDALLLAKLLIERFPSFKPERTSESTQPSVAKAPSAGDS